MSDQIRAGIDGMVAAIEQQLAQVQALKMSVNVMCRQIGEEPRYPDADNAAPGGGGVLRADQFYGKALATAVREYLERIKRAAGTEEIVKALEQGGYDFNEQGWKKGHRPRILAIALVKNSVTFRRLPNGMFGMESWYEPRTKKAKGGEPEITDADEALENNGAAKAATTKTASTKRGKDKKPAGKSAFEEIPAAE